MHPTGRTLLAMTACAGCLAACSPPASSPARVSGSYDADTGQLRVIALDSDNDGRADTWSHMDGARVVRVEIDTDHDGTIDRWEYYGPDGRLERVGYSRAGTGTPDAWAWPDASGQLARLELADAATGVTVRTEYYDGGVIQRAIDDTDRDGRPDKWEDYAGGRLVRLALDLSGRGTPERRLHYGNDGSLERSEHLGEGNHPSDPPVRRTRSGRR
jgi:hypothetical protein